jgi:NADH:flavin oxidoreductase / NADH oxidase family
MSALASRIKLHAWFQRFYRITPPIRSSSSVATEMASFFNPIKVGSLTLSNRVGMSALTRNRAPGTVPTDLMAEYYAQRAAGGAGLIVSEGILISRQGFC